MDFGFGGFDDYCDGGDLGGGDLGGHGGEGPTTSEGSDSQGDSETVQTDDGRPGDQQYPADTRAKDSNREVDLKPQFGSANGLGVFYQPWVYCEDGRSKARERKKENGAKTEDARNDNAPP